MLQDLEPRLPTVYRLRLGQKSETRKDKYGNPLPEHLAGAFRVTSAVPAVISEIAERYDGTDPKLWASADGDQMETILPAVPLKIVLLPGQALSQWWEKWDSGGCTKRCDGVTDHLNGTACSCPQEVEKRLEDRRQWCQPITRLAFLLPRLKLLCAGRLDSTGVIAAQGIGATIELAQAALDEGVMVGATLAVRMRGTGAKQYVWPELTLHGEVPAGVLGGGRNTEIGTQDPPGIQAPQEA
jgi:hypothetical protein